MGVKDPSGAVAAKAGRTVKMSNVLDPIDDMEVVAAPAAKIEEWFSNYRAVKCGAPLVEVEPSPDQVNALYVRVVELDA